MRLLSKIKKNTLNAIHTPNKDAILLFGLNKSGTSVTINLVAKRAGISFFDDFPYHLGGFDEVLNKKITLNNYVKRHSYAFSKDLIRYPIRPEAQEIAWDFFNQNKFILTIRNPVDNIKSILSRLAIPGNLDQLDIGKLNIHYDWKRHLSKSNNYVESLAICWREAYQQFYPLKDHCILFKYEDFKMDKVGYITQKVGELGLDTKYSIDQYVDIQYQPKGKNISNKDFFSKENIDKINEITGELASRFGYGTNKKIK